MRPRSTFSRRWRWHKIQPQHKTTKTFGEWQGWCWSALCLENCLDLVSVDCHRCGAAALGRVPRDERDPTSPADGAFAKHAKGLDMLGSKCMVLTLTLSFGH